MLFDFDSFLKGASYESQYDIERLTGGVVNVTVRAVRRSGILQHALLSREDSIILKHAPPYVAAVGPDAVLTQARQTAESNALGLFGQHGLLSHVPRDTNVRVPELLYHDPEQHVLVMSDLGCLPSLSEIFSVLGGYTPEHASSGKILTSSESHDRSLSECEQVYYHQIGSRLGSFFADVHSPTTLDIILNSLDSGATFSINPQLSNSVYTFAIQPLQSRLETLSDLIPSGQTATSLYTRVEADWLRETPSEEKSFILGDCWTGAVLVSPPPSSVCRSHASANLPDPFVGVIDWEFASLTRGPHGDIPQFLAHLEVFLHAAQYHWSTSHVEALEALITTMVNSYRSRARHHNPDTAWLAPLVAPASVPAAPHPSTLRARIIRSALLALASEMLNCAFWKVWPCHDPKCPASTTVRTPDSSSPMAPTGLASPPATPERKPPRRPSFQTYASPPQVSPPRLADALSWETPLDEEVTPPELPPHDADRAHLCPLVRSMVRSSIWLMERAGEDVEQMCDAENWAILVRDGIPVCEEVCGNKSERRKRRGQWLLDLFL